MQLIILAQGEKSLEISSFHLDYFPESNKANFDILLRHYILKRKHHLFWLYIKKKKKGYDLWEEFHPVCASYA